MHMKLKFRQSVHATARPVTGDLNSDRILTPADAAIALAFTSGGSASCDPAMLAAADVSGGWVRHIARRAYDPAGGGWSDNTMTTHRSINNWLQLFVVFAKVDDMFNLRSPDP